MIPEQIKLYLIAGALLVCTLVGGAVSWVFTRDTIHQQQTQISDLTAQVKAMQIANTALRASSATKTARNAATAASTKGRTDALNTALTANPAWAAQRVPDDVAAALGVRPTADQAEPASGP